MPITVFRSRLDEEYRDEYTELLNDLLEIAPTMPGFVSLKGFTAADASV